MNDYHHCAPAAGRVSARDVARALRPLRREVGQPDPRRPGRALTDEEKRKLARKLGRCKPNDQAQERP